MIKERAADDDVMHAMSVRHLKREQRAFVTHQLNDRRRKIFAPEVT